MLLARRMLRGMQAPIIVWVVSLVLLFIVGGSIAAAFYAQSLFTFHVPALVWPAQIYVAAAAVFAVFFRRPGALRLDTPNSLDRLPLRAMLVFASIAAFILSWRLATRFPQDTLAMFFWLLAILLLFFGLARWPGKWTKGVAEFRALAGLPWMEVAVSTIVVGAALGIRLYRLDEIPSVLGDEPITGFLSLSFNIFGDVPLYIVREGVPYTQFAIYGVSFASFGESIASLRLPNVILGALEVFFAYLLGKEIGGRRTGLIAAVLLAGLAVHVHFSRVALSIVAGSAAWTGLAAFLARGIRRGSWLDWTLAGLIAGLGVNWYHTPRFLPLVFAIFFAGLLVIRPRPVRWLLPGFVFVAVGFVVGVGPIASFFWNHPQEILGRSQESWLPVASASLMNPSSLPQPVDVGQLLWRHLQGEVLGLNLYGDAHTWYRAGLPMLGALISPVFFLGLAAVTLRIFDWRYLLIALWLWVPFLVFGVGSNMVPVFHRPVPFLAPAVVVAAVALTGLGTIWERVFHFRVLRWPLWLAVGVFVVVVGAQQFSDYFLRYTPRDSWPQWDLLARYIYQLGPENSVVMVGNLDSTTNSRLVQFGARLGKKNGLADWNDATTKLAPVQPGGRLVFIAHPSRAQELPMIKRLYPGGSDEQLGASGKVWWYVYKYEKPR